MAYLTINGVTVPVISGGEREVIEVGMRRRAQDGTYIRDTRAFKRVWRFTTPPLGEYQALALENLIQGKGLYFPYDGSAYASNGFGPTSIGTGITYRVAAGTDGALSYDESGIHESFVGADSVAGGEVDGSSINMLTAAQAQGTSTSGMAGHNGATISSSTTHAWEETHSIKVQGDGVTAAPYLQLNSVSGVKNHVYTASCYVLGTAGTTAQVVLTDTGSTTVTGTSSTITLNGTWQRMAASITANNVNTPVLNVFVESAAATTVMYVDGLQLEDNTATSNGVPIPTSFSVPTATRGRGQILYTINPMGYAGLTVNLWTPGPYSYNDLQYLWYAADAGSGAQNAHLRVPVSTPTSLTFATSGPTTSDNLTATGLTYAVPGTWSMITCVIRLQPETGETLKAIYYNGALKATSNTAGSVPTATALTRFAVLDTVFSSNTTSYLSYLDEVLFLPFPLNAADVLGLYNAYQSNGPSAGAGIGILPRLLAAGDFSPDQVTVQGMVDKTPLVEFYDSTGTWHDNGYQLNLTLEEV